MRSHHLFLLLSTLVAAVAIEERALRGKNVPNPSGVRHRKLAKKTKARKAGTPEPHTKNPNEDGSLTGVVLADIRFNKCPPLKEEDRATNEDYVDGVHKSIFPLVAADYPVSGPTATILKTETDADSVVVVGDVQLHTESVESWREDPETGAVIDPIYPADALGQSNDAFWDELMVVALAQMARREGNAPSHLNRWPDIWDEKKTLDDVAEAVHGEYPASIQATFIETVFAAASANETLQVDLGQPFRSFRDFIGFEIRIAAINTWTFEAVGPVNFMLKWYFGVPRPEEMVWKIHTQQLTHSEHGVPHNLVQTIRHMDLNHQFEFTAYPDGSPTHPSFPAMHSAGSTCSLWLPALYKLTPDQYCEALRVDYAVAFARTVAGVHYPQDNLAGLNIGQRIIREQLPEFVAERYGYDSTRVAAKLVDLSFDWKTFDSERCTIDGVPAAEFLERAGN